jgi:hypothetical protein
VDIRDGLVPEDWEPGPQFQNQFRTAWSLRDHMHAIESQGEFWLHEGEYGVMDLGIWWAGDDMPDALTYELMVFVDLRPVDAGFIEVEPQPESGPFPTLEDARKAPLERSSKFTISKRDPFVVTVVIPPAALGELGAHDVRVVFVPDNSDRGEEFGIPILGNGPSFTFTGNYGGTQFVAKDDLNDRDPELEHPPGEIGSYLSRPNIFVHPPVSTDELKQTDIHRTFEADDERVTLRGWVEHIGEAHNPDRRRAVTVVVDNQFHESKGAFTLPGAPPGVLGYKQTDREYAARWETTVSLSDDEPHRVRAFAFTDPFCRADFPDDRHVSSSNVVTLKHSAR